MDIIEEAFNILEEKGTLTADRRKAMFAKMNLSRPKQPLRQVRNNEKSATTSGGTRIEGDELSDRVRKGLSKTGSKIRLKVAEQIRKARAAKRKSITSKV